LKISYFSSAILPSRTANSIHVMKMCNALSKLSHDVTLYAPDVDCGIEANVENIFDFYGVGEAFKIIKAYYPNIKGRAYISSYLAVRKSLKNGIDLSFSRNLLAAYLCARNNIPTVFEIHQPVSSYGYTARILFNQLVRSKSFKKLVVITKSLESYFLKLYPQLSGKIIVAPDAADPSPENIKPLDLRTGQRLMVGYVGQLYSGKGMELISKLCRLMPSVDFHIVGGVDKDIAKWRKETEGADNIFYHGFLPHAQVSRFINEFDVVLLPNQRSVATHGGRHDIGEWTSPLKMFEYMAAGKAIVSSDLPVLQEVLKQDFNAKLCSPDDVNDWVIAINELGDEGARKRLADNAKLDFIQKYTWQTRAKTVLLSI
jgi:Glycosyltransferase